MNDASNAQLLKLSMLLLLEQRLRNAEKNELPFIIVNETAKLIAYDQAILWQPHLNRGKKIRSISGVTAPDIHSPFLLWLNKTLPSLHRHLKVEDKPITANADQCPSPIQDKWKDWLSPYIMWIPLTAPGKSINGYLLLVRSTPFTDGDITVMNHLSGAMGQALALEQSIKKITSKTIWQRQNFIKVAIIITLVCLFFFPIRQFSMAPAEIVPVDPIVIRSPLEGVIKTIHKESNARVLEGNLLFELDQMKLENQRKVAIQRLEVTKAQLFQAQQMAFNNTEAKSQISVLAQKIEMEQAETAYLDDLMKRTMITAPRDGILIFNDPDEWIGRPVEIGQKIMLLADPMKIELKISMPVKESVAFQDYGPVDFFLNISPTRPLKATAHRISYGTHVTMENTTAYRIWASFENYPSKARIGLQGTAKVYGPKTRLGIWILRKPLNLIFRWIN